MNLSLYPVMKCSMNCSWCNQLLSNENVRATHDYVDSELAVEWLQNNHFSTKLSLLGGEATLHPKFKYIVEELSLIYEITVTTNLFSGIYNKLDDFIAWAKQFEMRWNTSFHPGQGLSTKIFIERVRRLKAAGINVDQVASVDTHDLTSEIITELQDANVGWTMQYNVGFGVNTGAGMKNTTSGNLIPKTSADIRTGPPLTWLNYEKYIGMNYPAYEAACGKKKLQTVSCSVEDSLIIGPDNHLYTCNSLCYSQRKNLSLGHLKDNMDMQANGYEVGTPITCTRFGECSPCDIGMINIRKLDKTHWERY